jgi:hypothetical protein
VVVLSPHFFEKDWPQRELDGLSALEEDGVDRILPIWHGVDREQVARFSPTLAGRLAVSSSHGMATVVKKIQEAVGRIPVTSPLSTTERRALDRAAVDRVLRARNLVGDEDQGFGINPDSKMLVVEVADGVPSSNPCQARVALSLVPIGSDELLDDNELFEWSRTQVRTSPLWASDRRPRFDGVILTTPAYGIPGLTRYTLLARSGYVEWGRALGGRIDDVCIVRLGPLLWAVRHLYDFLPHFTHKFGIRSHYELVVSVSGAKGTCLSHLGEGWLEPWAQQFRDHYRPTCTENVVQYRRALPVFPSEEDKHSTLISLDRYLNRVWGDGDLRGHDRVSRGSGAEPILSDKYKEHDPWESIL